MPNKESLQAYAENPASLVEELTRTIASTDDADAYKARGLATTAYRTIRAAVTDLDRAVACSR